ncbi:MAG: ammonia-forming cytochrome c nitrite reductase subunit c552 [Desulfuromonadales bacterium]|nr:ammonia-forming cytochrome c nitrite reductase subunit c552 [Desulfuromonadales bacterium]MDW7756745.1 ammonia-forming cytochrome c nitrite reductase subunit c552 [Desulfuromonadales bacterium]
MKEEFKRIGKVLLTMSAAVLLLAGCQPEKAEMVRPVEIPAGEIDPAVWGKAYPVHYDLWKKTEEPLPAGKSKYRPGFDADRVTYDKLSAYPYLALLFNGWGFGVEYNEPRGHAYMIRDQLEIDSSRIGAGGVCLTCKTPYAPKLEKDMGVNYYKNPFMDVLHEIPEKHHELGVACIDCHDPKDMSLNLSREFTLGKGLDALGTDEGKLSHQQMRTLVCAQCHVTYNIVKDENKKSVGIYFPWQESQLGKITIENIIAQFRKDPTIREWKQSVTGFALPFIRHPEFELFSNDSVHWMAGASCTDCHMPYTKVGSAKVSDHRVASPLKADLKACQQCHAEGADWLRQRVYAIQDRTVSMQIRAGYATATVAKLFELTHQAQADGKKIDQDLYDQAKEHYIDAFFRNLFIGAENSMGFHNPPEAARVLSDAVAFAGKAEGLLRQALAQAGVSLPANIDLELEKYLHDRGKNKVPFRPEQVVEDPFGNQEKLTGKQI